MSAIYSTLLLLMALPVFSVPVNIAVVEKLIDKKIAQAILLTPSNCTDGWDNLKLSILSDLGLQGASVTTTDDGGWTVFQRRYDGTIDFYRNWDAYVNGFGDTRGEFWLGLETIHQMTKHNDQELEINMASKGGVHYTARYRYFQVGSALDNYRLTISGFSGNASDTMRIHNHCQFTTFDADHDSWEHGNCGTSNQGSWWYKRCGDANLNGRYHDRSDWSGLVWYHRSSGLVKHLRSTEMKFRRRQY